MQKSSAVFIFVFVIAFLAPSFRVESSRAFPYAPASGASQLFPEMQEAVASTSQEDVSDGASGELLASSYWDPRGRDPAQLEIPSIALKTRVIPVGVNEKGEMDVPDGNTEDVGWYEAGTIPGEFGSAVLDAHVYAAFRSLKDVSVGDAIFVASEDGSILRFVVKEAAVYPLADVPRERLFLGNDDRHLNLITCAGRFSKDLDTYTHRLIVYAVLAE